MQRLFIILIAVISIFVSGLIYFTQIEAQGIPSIPHGKTGFENCLSCHATGVLPASHSGYKQETCLACHTFAAAPPQPSPAQPAPSQPIPSQPAPAQPAAGACLSCHSQTGLSMDMKDGTKLKLYIDAAVFNQSVHGKLGCTDCHSSITGYPHPKKDIAGARQYTTTEFELCKKCHADVYTGTLDSAHNKVLAQGDLHAAVCTDCHGAHNVNRPGQPRSQISASCSGCHAALYNQYAQSVHGKALNQDNPDVPVCNDCHTAHKIEDPETAAFRIRSVELCSNCHGNEQLMQKYNISTNVVQSYLQDFHGATVALISKESKDIWVETAVCTDCHGTHNIKSVADPDSSVIKANLTNTCSRCHPNIGTNFPGAWLSHYEPSISNAPAVFAVQWFYRIFIPFILLGLCAHLFIDVWRALSRRK